MRAARKAVAKPRQKTSLVQALSSYVPKLLHDRIPSQNTRDAACELLLGTVLFTGSSI